MRLKRRTKPVKDGVPYRQLWRVVDGAILDCMRQHPNYFANAPRARLSLNKRIVGNVLGFAEQSAKGRSGDTRPAAETREAETPTVPFWRAALTRWVRRGGRGNGLPNLSRSS